MHCWKVKARERNRKRKLAEQIDRLDVNDKSYDAKYADYQARLDKFYEEIDDIEDAILLSRQGLIQPICNKGAERMQFVFEIPSRPLR